MPRPTPAQLACGSTTVVLSTLAMLLLSEARSGAGVVAAAMAGLMLGVLVTLALSRPRASRAMTGGRTEAEAVRPVPRPRVHCAPEPRLSEGSLRR